MKEFDFICYKYVHCNMVIASPPLEIGRQQCTLTIQFLWEKLNYTLSILKIADAQIFPSSTRPIISISDDLWCVVGGGGGKAVAEFEAVGSFYGHTARNH
jgi:hypothetical protein